MLLAAIVWQLSTLGQTGFWSELETPILDRSRAALGESLRNLVRSPWLPDAVRTVGWTLDASPWGLRLPHALATSVLLAWVAWFTHDRTRSLGLAGVAVLVAAAMPQMAMQGRTVLGNPFLELAIATAWGCDTLARRARSRRTRMAWDAGFVLALVAGTASGGIVLGAGLPLAALACLDGRMRRRRLALGIAAAITLGIAAILVARQGEGYIPLLGSAQDLALRATPTRRRVAAVLEECSHAVFPWLGFVLAGALHPGARRFAAWLAMALVLGGAWTVFMGPVALPVLVPAAVCGALALRTLVVGREPLQRRFALFVVALATLVTRQDAALHTVEIALPSVAATIPYPAETLAAADRLQTIAGLVLLASIAATLLGGRTTTARWRRDLGVLLVAGAATFGAIVQHHVLLPATGHLLSLRAPLQRYAAWERDGIVSAPLLLYRVQDPGLRIDGPATFEVTRTLHALQQALAGETPRAALIRERDFAALEQPLRERKRPLHVLDRSHQSVLLVANVLPPGAHDDNPLVDLRRDAVPALAHPTHVRFGQQLEIVGWELDEPLVRGRASTLTIAIRVLQRVSPSTELYARLLHGRLSRMNTEPQRLGGNIYPPAHWRPGDVIVHRFTFEVPPLEVFPGTYDLVVGFRKNAQQNYEISLPSPDETSPHGVLIRDRKREFARIGTVRVW